MRPFLVIALLCASAAMAAEFPGVEVEMVELSNGLRLYVAEDRFQPLVTLKAVVAAGERYNPSDNAEISLFVARGIGRGIPGLEGYALDKQIEKLGARFSNSSGRDAIFLTADVLAENWCEALRVFSEMLMNPTFPKQEIALLKQQRVSEWTEFPEYPSALGLAYSMNALYGGAFAPCDAERAASKLSRNDVVKFHGKYFRPNRTSIIVIGDFEVSDAIAALREAFEKWPRGGEAIASGKPRTPVADPPRVRLVNKPELTQATAFWVQHSISRVDTNRFALDIANLALQKELSFRLRSEGGRTYDIQNWHQGSSDEGQYSIVISTRNDGLAATIDTVRAVTAEFVRNGMTQEQFDLASKNKLGSFPLELETPPQIATNLAAYLSRGLSLDDFRSIPSAYQAVTIEEANHVSLQAIRPDDMIWVIVGDKSEIGDDLKNHFGKIQTVYYKDGVGGGNLITRARLGIGGAWNSAARGPRLSLLSQQVLLSATYGFGRSNDTWDYNQAWQVTLDLHKNNSRYSGTSPFIGVTGTAAGDVKGLSPHVGLRIFPYAIGYHLSIATDVGWSFWDKWKSNRDLPGFQWSIGLDYFF